MSRYCVILLVVRFLVLHALVRNESVGMQCTRLNFFPLQEAPRRSSDLCLYRLAELLTALLGIRLRAHLLRQQKTLWRAANAADALVLENELVQVQQSIESKILPLLNLIGCAAVPRPSSRDCEELKHIFALSRQMSRICRLLKRLIGCLATGCACSGSRVAPGCQCPAFKGAGPTHLGAEGFCAPLPSQGVLMRLVADDSKMLWRVKNATQLKHHEIRKGPERLQRESDNKSAVSCSFPQALTHRAGWQKHAATGSCSVSGNLNSFSKWAWASSRLEAAEAVEMALEALAKANTSLCSPVNELQSCASKRDIQLRSSSAISMFGSKRGLKLDLQRGNDRALVRQCSRHQKSTCGAPLHPFT